MLCNLLRSFQIVLVLYKRGALFLLSDLRIVPGFIIFPLSIFSIKTRAMPRGRRIKLILQDLGPFFIKFGQTLATREDIVGIEIATELSELQDKLMPRLTKSSVRYIIKKELGRDIEDLFKDFSENPIAAASIAEVFRAEDFFGQKVAVKILKPGIKEEFEKDLRLFLWIAKIIDSRFASFKRLKLVEVVESFAKGVSIEMDLTLEAAAASELREHHKDDTGVYIPKIFWDKVSRKILTIEWIPGIPINRVSEIRKRGIDVEKVIHNFTHLFLNEAYRDGFFHADLHPGNVLVQDNGDIALIDFGIMGRLDRKTRMYLAEILKGFLSKDYDHVARVHFTAGYVSTEYSIAEFSQACRAIGEPIVGMPASKISIGNLLAQLFKVTRDFNMPTQTKLLLIQKTTVVVEGVVSKLDSQVNMWDTVEPWVKEWSQENMRFDSRIVDMVKDTMSFIENDVVKFIRNSNKEAKESEVVIVKTLWVTKTVIWLLALLSGILILDKLT